MDIARPPHRGINQIQRSQSLVLDINSRNIDISDKRLHCKVL
jgi:hypothetical protein